MIPATLALDDASERLWDVVILGAGPAGSLAARQLASRGASVLLVEKKSLPRPKVCGACLNGQALQILRSVGLISLVSSEGGMALDQLHLGHDRRAARLPLVEGCALSRFRFDAALARAAIEAGANFLPETDARVEPAQASDAARVTRLDQQGRKGAASARVVLVAAGLGKSCLPGASEFRTNVSRNTRMGMGCELASFPEFYRPKTIFMAVGRGGYVGMVRVENDRLNLAAALDRGLLKEQGEPGLAVASLVREAGFPDFDPAVLQQADWHGTIGLTRTTKPLAAHRLFLLGDAAGYVEPFTGEGMGWALTSAVAIQPLVEQAIIQWHPSVIPQWARMHHRLVGRRQRFCGGLAFLLKHPAATRLAFQVVTRLPLLSRQVLREVNAPSASPVPPIPNTFPLSAR